MKDLRSKIRVQDVKVLKIGSLKSNEYVSVFPLIFAIFP